GIVITAMGRRNHGRAAVIGLLGCVALLIDGLLRLGQVFLLPAIVSSGAYSEVAAMIGVFGLLSFVLSTTGIGLLIWAVVARRAPQQPASPAPGWQQPYPPPPPPQQGWHQPPPR